MPNGKFLQLQLRSATDNFGNSYNVTSSGTNSQGNSYDSRDYGSSASNSNVYHLQNIHSDDSYYYSNSNGSTYHNDGSGKATYTGSNGSGWSTKQ